MPSTRSLDDLPPEVQLNIYLRAAQFDNFRITATKYKAPAGTRSKYNLSVVSTNMMGFSSKATRGAYYEAVEDYIVNDAAIIPVNIRDLTFENFRALLKAVYKVGRLAKFQELPQHLHVPGAPLQNVFYIAFRTTHNFPRSPENLSSFNSIVDGYVRKSAPHTSLLTLSHICYCKDIEPLKACNFTMGTTTTTDNGSVWWDITSKFRNYIASARKFDDKINKQMMQDDAAEDWAAYNAYMAELQKNASEGGQDGVGRNESQGDAVAGAEQEDVVVKIEEDESEGQTNSTQVPAYQGASYPVPMSAFPTANLMGYPPAMYPGLTAAPAQNMIGYNIPPPPPNVYGSQQQGKLYFWGNMGYQG